MRLAALAIAALTVAAAATAAVPAPPGPADGATPADVLRAVAALEGLHVPPADARCPSLAEALALHAARLGVPAPLAPAVAGGLDRALGCLLLAAHEANLAMDATFEGVPAADLAAAWRHEERAAALVEGRDHRANLAAAIHAAERVERAIPVLRALRGTPVPSIDLEPFLRLEPGLDTVHAEEYAVLVDLGGNDLYDNHAGGVFLAKAEPGSEFNSVQPGSAWMEIGLADGSDFFVGASTQDADLVASAGIVIDLGGDDVYGVLREPLMSDLECPGEPRVAWVGTQGGGVIGLGFLHDEAGNDLYRGRTAAQGAGHVMGVGVLRDADGNDRYEAQRLAQGSALLGGVGVLVDEAGDDAYVGWIPEGGIFNGDLRRCDLTARYLQGSIFDNKEGGGPPMAGVLVDGGGRDAYVADEKSQAFAQGVGLALLDERGGSDTYVSGDLSQGAAQGRPRVTAPPTMAGLAVLLERAGDDTFTVTGRGQGHSTGDTTTRPLPAPTVAAILEWAKNREEIAAALLDASGADAHAGAAGRADGATLYEGVLGVFHDEA